MGNKPSVHKIVVVGLQGSGKSTYCSLFCPRNKGFFTDAFTFFEHPLTDNHSMEVWDLNGKHTHLWGHHFKNADGFVFIIDQIEADRNEEYL